MTPKPTVTTAASAPSGQSVLKVTYRSDWRLKIVIFLLLMALAYLVFTFASMVPQARAHFIDLLLNPRLDFFMSSRL